MLVLVFEHVKKDFTLAQDLACSCINELNDEGLVSSLNIKTNDFFPYRVTTWYYLGRLSCCCLPFNAHDDYYLPSCSKVTAFNNFGSKNAMKHDSILVYLLGCLYFL